MLLQPDNCGATHIVIGDGGNEEGVENDYTTPQAAWSAYRDLDFGQASFVIVNETSAEWAWRADDGTSLDQVWVSTGHKVKSLGSSLVPASRLSAVFWHVSMFPLMPVFVQVKGSFVHAVHSDFCWDSKHPSQPFSGVWSTTASMTVISSDQTRLVMPSVNLCTMSPCGS